MQVKKRQCESCKGMKPDTDLVMVKGTRPDGTIGSRLICSKCYRFYEARVFFGLTNKPNAEDAAQESA